MIIIYYRDKQTGKYTRVHANKPEYTMADLEPLISDYNKNGNTDTVGAIEVADDSLEAFLFNSRNRRKDIDTEALHEAIEYVEDALHHLRLLEE